MRDTVKVITIDRMSLRDWFAGLALQGLLAGKQNVGTMENFPPPDGTGIPRSPVKRDMSAEEISGWAYHLADYMMDAKENAPKEITNGHQNP